MTALLTELEDMLSCYVLYGTPLDITPQLLERIINYIKELESYEVLNVSK